MTTSLPAIRRALLTAGLGLAASVASFAQEAETRPLSLAWIFTDHMVLQRDRPVPVWGRAAPGAEILVSFGRAECGARADELGRWRVELPAMRASAEGRVLACESGSSRLALVDVLVGEVWLCAGQSNMDFELSRAADADWMHYGLPSYPIRLCDRRGSPGGARRRLSPEEIAGIDPRSWYSGGWLRLDDESMASFSAVGFFFGLELCEGLAFYLSGPPDHLEIPVGLIDVSAGGSATEGWISRERLRADPLLAPLAEDYLESPLSHPFIRERTLFQLGDWVDAGRPEPRPRHFFEPGFLWEAAIEPLAPFPLAGVLWYQGESNAHLPRIADRLFRAMVVSWREAWGDTDLPFHFVQLPGMERPTWPAFREVQQGWLDIPATAMAVAIDLGHPTDVHPRIKRPIGERLARIALDRVYGQPVESLGPAPLSMRREGRSLVIELEHAEGLAFAVGREGLGFEVAGEDLDYAPARAEIDGSRIILSSPEIPEPATARYAWAPFPEWSLVNAAGLPAAPFRLEPPSDER